MKITSILIFSTTTIGIQEFFFDSSEEELTDFDCRNYSNELCQELKTGLASLVKAKMSPNHN